MSESIGRLGGVEGSLSGRPALWRAGRPASRTRVRPGCFLLAACLLLAARSGQARPGQTDPGATPGPGAEAQSAPPAGAPDPAVKGRPDQSTNLETSPNPAPAEPTPDEQAATAQPPVAQPATSEKPTVASTAATADTVQGRQSQPGVGVSIGPVDLRVRGYFRAPLRVSFRSRNGGGQAGDSGYNIHSPWLVDDDYFRSGFQYLRTQESDWSEIYFSAGNKYLSGDVALMGSLYSDWARPLLDRQWGIAQGFLTFRWESLGPRLRFRMHVRAGAFWDRFGWLENYDTYLFGRTHQLGGQVRLEFGLRDVTLWLVQGVGAHQEALDANQGLTLLNYLHAGLDVRRFAQVGFYFLDTQSSDRRQLKEIQDASMRIIGLDARISPWVGSLYLGGSLITASQAQYLSPVVEVMHALGGRGLVENYLGTDKSDGVGSVWNLAGEYSISLQRILRHFSRAADADVRDGREAKDARGMMKRGEVTLKWFGLLAYTQSKQVDPDPAVNRDGRLSFKWGAELLWQPLSFLFASLRYDRVIIDVQDDAAAFRVLTPRIGLTINWLIGAQIFLQYSHYDYGERVRLRSGQVALETLPDTDVVKLQAQVAF